MRINYIQKVKVNKYALIAKLWKATNPWFVLSGVVGNTRNRIEVFETVELRPGDRIFISKNSRMLTARSPKYLLFVEKKKT